MRPIASALLLALAGCGTESLGTHQTITTTDTLPPVMVPDAGMKPDAGSAPPLGATITADGVTFRVWAPHATAAKVIGDFPEQSVDMTPADGGYFTATVAGAHVGTIYHYGFDSPAGAITRVDPRCRQVLADLSGCTIVDPSAYAWKSTAFTRAAREATVVYELHVGSFAVAPGAMGGTFADAAGKLAELADLGINVVETMPLQHFGGKAFGWGYNPELYFTPKPTYGTADDLRTFVDAAHGAGIGVWLDTVVNHADGWSKAPLRCFDGDCGGAAGIYFFPPGTYAATPWGPRPDYTASEPRAMLANTVSWWLAENRGDGFRWDSVSNIRAIDGKGETPGGKDLLLAVNAAAHDAGALSIAEDLKGYDALTKPIEQGGFGFDAQWDGFGYTVANVLVPYDDDGRDMGAIQGLLQGSYAGDPFARLLFTEDHDTVGNGGKRLPSAIDPASGVSFAARRRSMLGAALLLTTPGVPMLFMGQESLAQGTFTDPPAPLADSIPPEGAKVRAFYKDLIALRRNLGGKSGGLMDKSVQILHRNDTNKVIAYRRYGASGEDVIVVLNFRNKAYTEYDVGVPGAGTWRIRVDADWKTYGDDFTGGQMGTVDTITKTKDGQPNTLPVELGAYAAVVFTR